MITVGRCKKCKYWETPETEGDYGRCHRYAPRPGAEANYVVYWPMTSDVDGCGEYDSALIT